jgi:hypothetical protein
MRLEKGVNKFRFLARPIKGTSFWTEDEDGNRKPVRMKEGETVSIGEVPHGEVPKHFWAAVVWNYATNQVQILEITQKTIQKEILALGRNPKWGAPTGYDINVTKDGDGMKTEYSVTPDPKEPVSAEIAEAFKAKPIFLEALYDNADPFAPAPIDTDSIPF